MIARLLGNVRQSDTRQAVGVSYLRAVKVFTQARVYVMSMILTTAVFAPENTDTRKLYHYWLQSLIMLVCLNPQSDMR